MKIPIKEVIKKIDNVLSYYPEDIFIPPNPPQLQEAHKALKAIGGTLDAISADNFRHILKCLKSDFEIRQSDEQEKGVIYLRMTRISAHELKQALAYLLLQDKIESLETVAEDLEDELLENTGE